ncbi:MAG: hypothetical protein WCY88_17620 [Spongiibacteraceae bacterium]
METQQFCSDIKEHLAVLDPLLAKLADLIQQEHRFAYYFQMVPDTRIIDEHLDYGNARCLIAAHLTSLDYLPKTAKTLPPMLASGLVCVPPAAESVIAQINDKKNDIIQWHKALRKLEKTEWDRRKLMRRVLSLAGRPLLNLDAIDAKITCISGDVTRIQWSYTPIRKSQRLTLQNAIRTLESLIDTVEDNRKDLIAQEIAQLQHENSTTPVAFRSSLATVPTLRYRARYLDDQGRVCVSKAYARNPVFIIGSDDYKPRVAPPSFNPRAGGRRRIISDESISFSLPNWFWYKNQEQKTIAKPTSRRREASQTIPGIWLGLRKGKPCVFVGCKGLPTTGYSIQLHGLHKAWEKAVDKLITIGKLDTHEKQWAMARCPKEIY